MDAAQRATWFANGLIGCFSADEKTILATAWEPYQELFEGVVTCIHSDFGIGGLKPNESKRIRGKLCLTDARIGELLDHYARDFPEQAARPAGASSHRPRRIARNALSINFSPRPSRERGRG
jgi:hypothetical protein